MTLNEKNLYKDFHWASKLEYTEKCAYFHILVNFKNFVDFIKLHVHNVRDAGGVGPGGGVKIHLSKIPRLKLSGGSSQEDFRQFKCQLDQYIRADNETDEVRFRDQLPLYV